MTTFSPTETAPTGALQSRLATIALWATLAVSLVLLYVAWTHPLLTVRVTGKLPELIPGLMQDFTILDETRSVMTMLDRLVETDYLVIAALILVFGVLLPIAKNIGVGLLLASQPGTSSRATARALQFMGRFAMVDIFAVSIIVSIIGAGTIGAGANDTPVAVKTITELRSGFYYFIVYVLLSFAMDVALAIRYRRSD